MAANKRPRKKYDPARKLRRTLSALNAQQGQGGLDDGAVTHILTANHVALEAIAGGAGRNVEWQEIAGALHVASVVDRLTYGGTYAAEIEAAIEAHAACGARMLSAGRVLYTGPQLTAVKHALEIHDLQVQQATRLEMEQAINTCKRESEDTTNPALPYNRARALMTPEGSCA